jgi:hypothetical protein
MELPEMALVEHQFNPQYIEDLPAAVREELASLNLGNKVKAGDTVAITAGSRGVANIDTVIKTVVEELKKLDTAPFVFPAMGSHGGGTAEGQIKVLANLGITEETMGCPIKSDMEPEFLGEAALGFPINVDKNAMSADHIVVVNRVKSHTKFEGPIESGIMKMMAIGMGKQKGAEYYHKAAVQLTFQKIVETVGLEVMKRCPVLFGFGTVENAYHQPCMVKALLPEDIYEGEKKLLIISKERMASIPFDEIDILIVDQIGKDISGTGMDTNVTGRNRDLLGDFTTRPRVKRVYVRDLTDKTEGNATGIGLAEFTSTRLVNKMDHHKTWLNVITGISPEKGATPIHYDTDREVLDACFKTIGNIPEPDARIVHIRDTLSVDKISVSKAYAEEIAQNSNLKLLGDWNVMALNTDGNIVDPF